MTRLAILNSEGLLGSELKDELRGRPELAADVRLVSADSEAVGTVTEGVDGAAFVQPATEDTVAGCEIVIICPGSAPSDATWIPADATIISATPATPVDGARIVVAGTNPHDVEAGVTIVSPHPASIALTYLLAPLRTFGIVDAACWSLLPASIAGQDGVDELLEQTRAVLTFQSELPTAVFGHQLAFSLLPSSDSPSQRASEISAALGLEHSPSMQLLQSGCFHGVTAGAHLRLKAAITEQTALEALLDSPWITRSDEPGLAGPVAAAGQPGIVLGALESPSGHNAGLTLWGAVDNLTLAGAGNIIGILEALVAPRH